MSLTSHGVRKLAIAGSFALASLATAASAQAADATLNYSCNYPLIGAQPLSIAINATIPSSVPAGGATGKFDIKATATASGNTPSGLNILGATSIEGTARAAAVLNAPGVNLDLGVPVTIANQSVPGTSANLKILASGQTPSIFLSTPGAANVTVGNLVMNLTARDASGTAIQLGTATDSDKNADTFDVNCTLAPTTQNTTLANFTVTDQGTAIGTVPPSVQPAAPAAPSVPDTTTNVDYGYSLAGQATLKNLVSGGLPLSGSIGAHLSLPSGGFTGDLKLAEASGNLRALGILPVQAKVALVPTAPVTGTLQGGVLKATAKVNIKLNSVTLAGIPLISPANCRALNTSIINLQSTDKFFYPLSGGTLAGTFSISDLVGCGPLNGIVSPLTKGGGNAIVLKLTPAV